MSIYYAETVKRWEVLEVTAEVGGDFRNPFLEVDFRAEVTAPNGEIKIIKGFYAGKGTWKVRIMPEIPGTYYFTTMSGNASLNQLRGQFTCILNDVENHGPVHAEGTHFFYADHTPAFICGTTLYAWWYRPDEVCDVTLRNLVKYGFNKVRMLVFPKYLAGFTDFELTHQPPCLPFHRDGTYFDFQYPVTEYFDLLEKRIKQLDKIGVEADIILFHNYDFGMWGIDGQLSDDVAEFYLEYMIARFGAFKNVWWSLANEYDIWKDPDGGNCIYKTDRRNWKRLGEFLLKNDPYNKLRSIHNIGPIYPNEEWVTHVSVQYPNTYSLLLELKNSYQKPVINDEYQYEGNLIDDWGNVSGLEETIRHWLSVMAGAYATHGECYVVNGNRKDIFWTYGGEIVGESAPRIAYLKQLAEGFPFHKMKPDFRLGDGRGSYCLRNGTSAFFQLFTPECQRRSRVINLGITDGTVRKYRIVVYDLWNMSILREFEHVQGALHNPDADTVSENPLQLGEEGLIGVYAGLV